MTIDGKKTGIVYLVGAGPGHPGLITRLGYELLQQCDAVAYDALIPMELISGLPESVERHYVGKRAGKHSLPQSQINELLATLARRGLNVVRLKGGDPFIFGRSGEEAEHLSAEGIPVVFVPGVTTASAVAATAGFSLTNRQAASWIFLGTGHGAENSIIPVPWEEVAALQGGTIVIYMGLAKLDHVVAQLISCGMPADTPAIAMQAVSTGMQQSAQAPLSELSRECKRQRLNPPVLIVIGETLRYRAPGTTIGSNALAGKTVLVTSPPPLNLRLCRMLRNEGAEPIPYPTVNYRQFDDVEGWARFQQLGRAGGVCLIAGEMEAVYFFKGLFARNLDARCLGSFKIIALNGEAGDALLERGIKADAVAPSPELQEVASCISSIVPHASSPLLFVHGGGGSNFPEVDFHKKLLLRFPDSFSLKTYESFTPVWEDRWKEDLENPPDCIAFTSAAEVEGFIEIVGTSAVQRLASRSCIASMGPSITAMLSKHELPVGASAESFCAGALVKALGRAFVDANGSVSRHGSTQILD